jgi:hypothetical protein
MTTTTTQNAQLVTSTVDQDGSHGRQAPAAVSPRPAARRAGSWWRRIAAVAALATVGSAYLTPVSEAATTYTVTSLTAQVDDQAVSTSVTVAASTRTTASRFKVCVRDYKDTAMDFPGLVDAVLEPTGTTYSDTKTFGVGTYRYWACLKVGDQWSFLGTAKTFTVVPRTTPTSTTSTMPTTSAQSAWEFSYGESFSTDVPLGQFSKVYGSRWAGYQGIRNDTSRNGSYQPDKVLSVKDGSLDMSLGYDAATGLYNVAAPAPQPPAGVNGGSPEYLGMRTSIRFKSSNAMPGYKTAWMLWPSSYRWVDGEIDFPESSLGGDIWGFAHEADNGTPEQNSLWVHSPATYFDGWHTATTEWIPGKSIEMFLDGSSLGKTTTNVPTKPMHWTLQTETDLTTKAPAQSVKGHLLVDWLTVETYKG